MSIVSISSSSSRIQMFQVNNPNKSKCDANGMPFPSTGGSIFNLICLLVIIALQFGKTAMFMWMLCEGIHLNNVLTISVFKTHFKTWYFYVLGWCKQKKKVISILLSLLFSCAIQSDTQLESGDAFQRTPSKVNPQGVRWTTLESSFRCFNNYMHLKYYWMIDGPRYAVMIVSDTPKRESIDERETFSL